MRSMHRHNGSTSMPQKNRATVFTVGAASKRPSINHSIRSDCPTRNHESIQTNGRPKDQRLGKHRICACLVGQGSGGCITECGRRPPPIRFTSFFNGGIRFSHRRFFFHRAWGRGHSDCNEYDPPKTAPPPPTLLKP